VGDGCSYQRCLRTAADGLLRQCPTLRIVATSREPIGLPGEVTWTLAPLMAPDHGAASVIEIERNPRCACSSSVPRPCSRRSCSAPTTPTPSPRSVAVWTACRSRSSWPRRAWALTPNELTRRLDSASSGGSRAALPRQQTLGATVDWSYQLLKGPSSARPAERDGDQR
jgi:predicted ATPase